MHVTLIEDRPFPGWKRLCSTLSGSGAMSVALTQIVIHEESKHDGVFVKVGPAHVTNLHLIQRVLLGRWANEGWAPPTAHRLQQSFVRLKGPRFQRVSEMLVGLRQRHPALRPDESDRTRRVASGLWFTTLEQRFVSRSSAWEMSRAFRMYEQLWPVVHGEPCLTSAFDSPAYVLGLSLAVTMHAKGYVRDARILFRETQLGSAALETLLEQFTTPAQDFLHRQPGLEQYPSTFENAFANSPILRVSPWALFTPDPTIVFGALENRLRHQVLATGDWEEQSKRFGNVFERYGQQLLEESAPSDFERPFHYTNAAGKQVETPDGFLKGATPITLEFKATELPQATGNAADLDEMFSWLEKLTGARSASKGVTARAPFAQGAAFFADASRGLVPGDLARQVGQGLYLIVSYDAPPASANWPTIRAALWTPRLSAEARAMLDRTAFISIRDLEVLAITGHFLRTQGTPRPLADLVKEWWNEVRSGPSVWVDSIGQQHIRGGLGSYLLERYSLAGTHVLPSHQVAVDLFFDMTTQLYFGG